MEGSECGLNRERAPTPLAHAHPLLTPGGQPLACFLGENCLFEISGLKQFTNAANVPQPTRQLPLLQRKHTVRFPEDQIPGAFSRFS